MRQGIAIRRASDRDVAALVDVLGYAAATRDDGALRHRLVLDDFTPGGDIVGHRVVAGAAAAPWPAHVRPGRTGCGPDRSGSGAQDRAGPSGRLGHRGV